MRRDPRNSNEADAIDSFVLKLWISLHIASSTTDDAV